MLSIFIFPDQYLKIHGQSPLLVYGITWYMLNIFACSNAGCIWSLYYLLSFLINSFLNCFCLDSFFLSFLSFLSFFLSFFLYVTLVAWAKWRKYFRTLFKGPVNSICTFKCQIYGFLFLFPSPTKTIMHKHGSRYVYFYGKIVIV